MGEEWWTACARARTIPAPNLESPECGNHKEAESGNKPELSDAQRIVAEQAARREAMFQQSVDSEKTRGDALSKRFEEALKQAREEPVTRPARDFDLD